MLTAEQALMVTQRLYTTLVGRRPDIERLEDYASGKHRLRFVSHEWAAQHEARYRGFSDNWCQVVASAGPEVTEVTGFRVGEDVDVLDEAERALWRDWLANELPAQSAQGWLTTATSYRSFAIVWGDGDGAPVVTWEHPSQVVVEYDPERPRVARFALKAWIGDDGAEHATLYTPDELWKWRASGGLSLLKGPASAASMAGGAWVPREVPGEMWPLRNPLGAVPVVEFPNRPVLKYGPVSDIAGVGPMQDAINAMWAYLMVAADFASLPQRVVMGQQPPKIPILDENGQIVGEQQVDLEQLRQGRLLWLTGGNAKIGEFSPASSDFFLNVINTLARHISTQTKTPIYLIHGELGNVNGDTLSALNEPRNAKVRQSQRHLGAGIRELMRLMALVRGEQAVADACRVGQVKWANPETSSDAQRADAAIKDKSLGLPLAAILEDRFGRSPDEIDRILQMVDEERAGDLAAVLTAATTETDAAARGA